MKLNEIPSSERPYEKLQMYGAQMLSNAELLAIVIKTGKKGQTAIEVAQNILALQDTKQQENLRFLQNISIEELKKIKGIGTVKAIQLKAIGEICKRMARPIHFLNVEITSSEDVANLIGEELRYEKREIAKVLILNAKNRLQKILEIGTGHIYFCEIEAKEIFVEALKMEMPKVILVHNHPSGDPMPSKADIELTKKAKQIGELLNIQFIDHIVIGDGSYRSIFLELQKQTRRGL